MAWINYNDERFTLAHWRIQCLKCEDILQTWDCSCSCGLIIVRNGQKTWPMFPTRDVSIWKSRKGTVLPQHILDKYFRLGRESNKTSTNTETGTSTSRRTH